ncbi:hypothetical protein K435DRAFT_858607 [Dendrothele bispora CBS 962.96]|uniref:Uncharacterized protein n=1 Tax=Dendrothele bispora (strain CBS 962.96) TaxID=1314807 RepID=A0A4S8M336_DENBC|nr:hypothetical protein K435DRAFT_858607 [Dendrothele bispora CBS 962.96]
MDRLNYIISDGIVVRRAWIMFPESRAVKLTLLFCMVGSLAAVFIDAGLAAVKNGEAANISKFNVLILTLPLLFTNMIATLLIGHKTCAKAQCWGAAVPELSALYPVLIIVIAAAENAKPTTIGEMSSSQSIRFASGQASSSEGHRSMTESQSNAPGTTTLLEAEAAEPTGGNLT